MLQAWLWILGILIRLGLVKLPQQTQPKQVDQPLLDQHQTQIHVNFKDDIGQSYCSCEKLEKGYHLLLDIRHLPMANGQEPTNSSTFTNN
jgi:hypothetical protein